MHVTLSCWVRFERKVRTSRVDVKGISVNWCSCMEGASVLYSRLAKTTKDRSGRDR